MGLTPVEIRHLEPARTWIRGYRRASVDTLLDEIVVSFEDVWREREFDDWTDPEPDGERTTVMRQRPRVAALPGPSSVRVHLVVPRSFNDAQQIADKFKDSIPVILNLQSSDQDLSKRLIDFASGLTYALDGGMQRVADKVFLLTPRNVEVSAEERARLLERGGFFNQA